MGIEEAETVGNWVLVLLVVLSRQRSAWRRATAALERHGKRSPGECPVSGATVTVMSVEMDGYPGDDE